MDDEEEYSQGTGNYYKYYYKYYFRFMNKTSFNQYVKITLSIYQ